MQVNLILWSFSLYVCLGFSIKACRGSQKPRNVVKVVLLGVLVEEKWHPYIIFAGTVLHFNCFVGSHPSRNQKMYVCVCKMCHASINVVCPFLGQSQSGRRQQ
jgi:hypothetical protein